MQTRMLRERMRERGREREREGYLERMRETRTPAPEEMLPVETREREGDRRMTYAS